MNSSQKISHRPTYLDVIAIIALLVLAIGALVAFIQIPNQETKRYDRQSAERLVSVHASAIAAGAVPKGTTTAELVKELMTTGLTPTEGAFKDKTFKRHPNSTMMNLPEFFATSAKTGIPPSSSMKKASSHLQLNSPPPGGG